MSLLLTVNQHTVGRCSILLVSPSPSPTTALEDTCNRISPCAYQIFAILKIWFSVSSEGQCCLREKLPIRAVSLSWPHFSLLKTQCWFVLLAEFFHALLPVLANETETCLVNHTCLPFSVLDVYIAISWQNWFLVLKNGLSYSVFKYVIHTSLFCHHQPHSFLHLKTNFLSTKWHIRPPRLVFLHFRGQTD